MRIAAFFAAAFFLAACEKQDNAREAVDPFAFMGCCPDICFAIQVFSR